MSPPCQLPAPLPAPRQPRLRATRHAYPQKNSQPPPFDFWVDLDGVDELVVLLLVVGGAVDWGVVCCEAAVFACEAVPVRPPVAAARLRRFGFALFFLVVVVVGRDDVVGAVMRRMPPGGARLEAAAGTRTPDVVGAGWGGSLWC